MLLRELFEDGRVVKGVNTTVDVGVDEIPRQARKFGNRVTRDGKPAQLRSDGVITESTVSPDRELVNVMDQVIDTVNTEYAEFLDTNNDQDDIEELADLLNQEMEVNELPIHFQVNTSNSNPGEWISAAASWEGDEDKSIDIILHARNLEGKWGPETFKRILMRAIKHETIHFGQYDRVGKDKLSSVKSGHQKGTELKSKGGTDRDWERSYLRDPHELMAYGHDLADEISQLDNPSEVIRNIEQYKQELPVYAKFRSIFPSSSPQIKQLLKYAVKYL